MSTPIVPVRKIDIHLEYALDSEICPVCGKLDMRPDFARVGANI